MKSVINFFKRTYCNFFDDTEDGSNPEIDNIGIKETILIIIFSLGLVFFIFFLCGCSKEPNIEIICNPCNRIQQIEKPAASTTKIYQDVNDYKKDYPTLIYKIY